MLQLLLINNNNIDTIFNINDTYIMKILLKNIKIDNFISSIKIHPFSKINKRNIINNRYSACLMIKEKGKTIYRYKDNDFVCDANNIVFIPFGSSYEYIVKENGYCYQINFQTSLPINDIVSFPINNPSILELFKKSTFINYSDPTNFTKQLSLIYEIISEIIHELESESDYLSFAFKIMQRELSNPKLDNNYIANELNISEVYLRKLFKNKLNTSPRQYLIKMRMEKAFNMLFNKYSIKEISQQVGYDSVYSFSRAFKSYYKKSPQNYIKHF